MIDVGTDGRTDGREEASRERASITASGLRSLRFRRGPESIERSARTRRERRAAALLVLAFALVSLYPRPARADFRDDLATGLAIFGALLIVDVTFLTYDSVVAGKGELPSTGWSVAEFIASTPQTFLASGLTIAGAAGSEPEMSLFGLPLAMVSGAMTTHSIWSLASTDVGPGTLFFVSPAIATDATLSAAAIGAMFHKRRLFTRPLGVMEVVVTVPQVVGGAFKLALDRDVYQPGWIALTAWSGALMLHGVASIALDRGRSSDDWSTFDVPLSPRARQGRLRPRINGFGPGPVAGSADRPPGYGFVMHGSF